ncbi:MAG: hypothetical protein JSS61_01210 [Verrucomicrobia bacterium]|nr:hypothetical protein [Verrucomicrobiota bacterium]
MSTSATQSPQSFPGLWSTLAPYAAPPLAASAAIVPVFRDLIAKSARQTGQPVPHISLMEGLKGGFRAAPTVGVIVGTQMVLQNVVEKILTEDTTSLSSMLASSALVGTASAPVLAVFNGQTMGWSIMQSLRNFSMKQGLAIAIQETAFVGGLSASDRLANAMKSRFGESKAIEYASAFTAGALGSLAGHPANTALTRWQSGLTVDTFRQSMWGAMRKARAIGCFSVAYKLGKEMLSTP